MKALYNIEKNMIKKDIGSVFGLYLNYKNDNIDIADVNNNFFDVMAFDFNIILCSDPASVF